MEDLCQTSTAPWWGSIRVGMQVEIEILLMILVLMLPYAKGILELDHFLSIRHAHGDICKHLGIYSSTDPDNGYSIGTRIYINRHVHTKHLK